MNSSALDGANWSGWSCCRTGGACIGVGRAGTRRAITSTDSASIVALEAVDNVVASNTSVAATANSALIVDRPAVGNSVTPAIATTLSVGVSDLDGIPKILVGGVIADSDEVAARDTDRSNAVGGVQGACENGVSQRTVLVLGLAVQKVKSRDGAEETC